MNQEEISSLPAGRDMDALIAQRIFGWQQDTSEEGDFFDFWITNPNSETESKVQLNDFRFSTDILTAWKLVENLGIIIGKHENNQNPEEDWCASFSWDSPLNSPVSAFASTPALAICRATLLMSISQE